MELIEGNRLYSLLEGSVWEETKTQKRIRSTGWSQVVGGDYNIVDYIWESL